MPKKPITFEAGVYEDGSYRNIKPGQPVFFSIPPDWQQHKLGILTLARHVASVNPNMSILHFFGYDDDPREVFEVPEVRDFAKWFEGHVEVAKLFESHSLFLFACCLCGAAMPVKGKLLIDPDALDYWRKKWGNPPMEPWQ